MGRYDENQKKTISGLLKNLSERPADLRDHIRLATGSLALSVAYGIEVDSVENPYFHAAEEATESIAEAMVPGAFLVELLPIRELSLSGNCSNTALNPLGSSLRSVVAPWRWFPQLRRTR